MGGRSLKTISGICLLMLFLSACQSVEIKKNVLSRVNTFFRLNEKFGEPFGVAVKNDEVFFSDGAAGKIWRLSKAGQPAVFSDKFDTPSQVAFDANGDLIIADAGSQTIKRLKTNGEVELVAGVENQKGWQDGEASRALFNGPVGVAVGENKIFVADTYNDKIRVIENGRVRTLAGSSQGFADSENNALEVKFNTPLGLALTKNGKLLVADSANHRLRLVEPTGQTRTLAGSDRSGLQDGILSEAQLYQPTALTVDENGRIYLTDGNALRVIENDLFPFVRTISNPKRGFVDAETGNSRFNRPSGLAVDRNGNLFIADSDNQTIRVLTGENLGRPSAPEEIEKGRITAGEFRKLQPPRWPYDPPDRKREIAGTLGEIRGEMTDGEDAYFHNGLDIVGGYGETARFVRTEKVLRPSATDNFDTLRESLRMPMLGYIHVRLGRDQNNQPFDDARFQFSRDVTGKFNGVRIARGTKFQAGESVGTLNPMNHVHLIAGGTGAEMNALDALIFPNISDKIAPTIEKISLFDENRREIETSGTDSRIKINGKTVIVVRAFDRMDGNAERRRLGIYKIGYQILKADQTPVSEMNWTIRLDRLPEPETVKLVYFNRSRSGATGETIFNYIASNEIHDSTAREGFLDTNSLAAGNYVLHLSVADYFGNETSENINLEVTK